MITRFLSFALLASLALGTPASADARIAAIHAYGDVVASPAAITAMDDGVLARTYPDKRAGLAFEEGRFSSDGAFFAFSVSQIESGDPEQVWLYDLRARNLVAATEAPKKSAVGFTISALAFGKDDTLYVSGERIDWQDQSNNRTLRVAATTAHSAEVKAFPKDADAAFAAQAAAATEDEDTITLHGDPFDVIARNRGHGVFTLSAKNRKTAKIRKIADGGWEFEHVLFDGRAKLRFGDDSGIVTVDLNGGTSRRLVVAHKRGPGRLLDQTRGGLVAYVMYGSCDPDKYGAVRGGDPQFVCFVKEP
ncbi:MAG: hypothetical protein KGM97_06145 [Alphaproteobacteria bacterium]|nr:hypothetical protein [Alphaproteobacteria bacterium]MDE2630554.1 hypothetical protein [Alphaproteobacteria bacterium]